MARAILFILIASYLLSSSAQDHSFRVMTYNIRLPLESDGINYWNNRRPLLASVIRYHAPDIIGVQEAYRRQLDEMISDHPVYAWHGVCRSDGTQHPDPDGEFSAILYRKDRFTLLNGNTFWLSSTPEIPGSIGWDAALPRIVTWGKFKDRQSGKDFYLFNTHFDHLGEKAREESAKLVLEKIKAIAGNAPIILMGDFNTIMTSIPYLSITKNSGDQTLVDAYTSSLTPHHGPLGSFSGNFTLPGVGDYRIDYVFVNKSIVVLKHAIISDSWDGRLPSDHLPVLAEIYIP